MVDVALTDYEIAVLKAKVDEAALKVTMLVLFLLYTGGDTLTKKRQAMPSLDRVQKSYRRQIEMLPVFEDELHRLMEQYGEAHDAGVVAFRSGMGKFGSRSSGFKDQSPEAGYEFHRLQGASAFAAGLIVEAERDLKRASQRIERAGAAIHNAWLDTDPEIGRERRAIRAAATQESQDPKKL